MYCPECRFHFDWQKTLVRTYAQMFRIMQLQVKSFRYCSQQTAEWVKNVISVTLTVMLVGMACIFFETADLEFSHTREYILNLDRMGWNTTTAATTITKHLVSGSSGDRFKLTGTQINTLFNHDELKSISEHVKQTWGEIQQQKTTLGSSAVSHEQESKAMVDTVGRLQKCHLVFFPIFNCSVSVSLWADRLYCCLLKMYCI